MNHSTGAPAPDNPRGEYHLTFRALPSSLPAIQRVKALLKRALRSYELVCTGCRPALPDEDGGRDE